MYLYTMIACFRHSDGWERAENQGVDEKLTRGKIGQEKGGVFSLLPQSPLIFFPLLFLFALSTYDLTCSPLSKCLELADTMTN